MNINELKNNLERLLQDKDFLTSFLTYDDSDYWFLIKEEYGHAMNPDEFRNSWGKKGYFKHAGIVHELRQGQYIVWGLVINPESKDIEWIDVYKNPELLARRVPFNFQENEVIGKYIIRASSMQSIDDNMFDFVSDNLVPDKKRLQKAYDAARILLYQVNDSLTLSGGGEDRIRE